MNDCSSVDSSFDFCDVPLSDAPPQPDSLAIRIGQVCFCGSVFAGAGYCISASCKKKAHTVAVETNDWVFLDLPDLEESKPLVFSTDSPKQQAPELLELEDVGDTQRENLRVLTDTLASCTGMWGGMKLLTHLPKLSALEKKLDPLHPFQFLLWTTHFFKDKTRSIVRDKTIVGPQKREGFCEGVKKGMERATKENRIEPYIHSFCRQVGTSPEAIRPFIERNNWPGLVDHLVDLAKP